MVEETRDWRVSEALDLLEPVFIAGDLTPEEVERAATVFGMPHYAMWKAHHLYDVIRGNNGGIE